MSLYNVKLKINDNDINKELKDYYIDFEIDNDDENNSRRIYFDILDKNCINKDLYQLYWVNRRGGVDSIIMTGNNIQSVKSNSKRYKTYKRSFQNGNFYGDESYDSNPQYLSEYKKRYSLNSYYIDEELYKYLEDIIYTKYVWLYSLNDDEIISVNIIYDSFELKNSKNQNELLQLSITAEEKITNTYV